MRAWVVARDGDAMRCDAMEQELIDDGRVRTQRWFTQRECRAARRCAALSQGQGQGTEEWVGGCLSVQGSQGGGWIMGGMAVDYEGTKKAGVVRVE